MKKTVAILVLGFFVACSLARAAEQSPIEKAEKACVIGPNSWFSDHAYMYTLLKKLGAKRPGMEVDDFKIEVLNDGLMTLCVYYRKRKPGVPHKNLENPRVELAQLGEFFIFLKQEILC